MPPLRIEGEEDDAGSSVQALMPLAIILLVFVLMGCGLGNDTLAAGGQSRPDDNNLILLGDAVEPIRAAVALSHDARDTYETSLLDWSPAPAAPSLWWQERYGVDPEELDPRIFDAARDRAEVHNADLSNLVELYLRGFEERLVEKFDAGDFACNPEAGAALSEAPPGFVGKTVTCDGWAVVIQLTPEADSDLMHLRTEIVERRRLRDHEVAQVLAGDTLD